MTVDAQDNVFEIQVKDLEHEIFELEHQIFAMKYIMKDLIKVWQTPAYSSTPPCSIESRSGWSRCPYCECEFFYLWEIAEQEHAKNCPIERARKLLSCL
jgi:hypothetical protein